MSVELIAIVTVGLTLAGLILTSNRGLRSDMTKVEERLRQDMKQAEERLESQGSGLSGEVVENRTELSQLRERMAHHASVVICVPLS